MVHGLRIIRDSLYEKFSDALSKIQNRNSPAKLSPERVKIFKGFLLLLISGVFAFFSHSFSQETAIHEWNQTHWPPQSVWEMTLKHQGLEKNANIESHTRLFREALELFSEGSSVWMTEDGCAVYINQSPYHGGPELWMCRKPAPQGPWTRLGSGLIAFEALVHFIESKPRVIPSHPKAIPIDPKELRY